jgi:hypothetical protein
MSNISTTEINIPAPHHSTSMVYIGDGILARDSQMCTWLGYPMYYQIHLSSRSGYGPVGGWYTCAWKTGADQ